MKSTVTKRWVKTALGHVCDVWKDQLQQMWGQKWNLIAQFCDGSCHKCAHLVRRHKAAKGSIKSQEYDMYRCFWGHAAPVKLAEVMSPCGLIKQTCTHTWTLLSRCSPSPALPQRCSALWGHGCSYPRVPLCCCDIVKISFNFLLDGFLLVTHYR